MPARLTALVLSFCIALPMCWCCVSLQAKADEPASCCAAAKSCPDGHEQAPQDKNCPCARHEAARDVTATLVKAPAPELKLVVEPVWLAASSELPILSPSLEKTAARHDHGPPLSAAPAYARHCALLL